MTKAFDQRAENELTDSELDMITGGFIGNGKIFGKNKTQWGNSFSTFGGHFSSNGAVGKIFTEKFWTNQWNGSWTKKNLNKGWANLFGKRKSKIS